MHIGYFSSMMGTRGGPAIVDKRVLEAISRYDRTNRYTVYGLTSQTTADLQLDNGSIEVKTIKPSGKWFAIPFGLTLELLRHPVDLLHATVIPPPVIPCKFVLTITCWSQYAQPEFYPPLKRWRLLYLLNKGIRKASAILCYTEYLRKKVIEQFGIERQRTFIVQPAVGEEIKAVEDKQALKSFLRRDGIEWPYILFIGALTKRKNVEGLIRAYHMVLQETGIEHRLVLLGEQGYYFGDISQTVEKLGLSERVVFIDRRPHHQLPYYYSGADVFVFPTFSEGFGLPPLEAMACGTPVVASNATSVPEVVGNAALLVDPYRPEDIAEAILKYLTDQELCLDFIARGIARAKQFTWQRAAVQTVAAYEKVYHAGW